MLPFSICREWRNYDQDSARYTASRFTGECRQSEDREQGQVPMTLLWHEVLGFLASFLIGTVFLDVFLTMYERHRPELSPKERRIFKWSVKGGIGIGILVVLLQFLLSN
jgi:hypothetical protein